MRIGTATTEAVERVEDCRETMEDVSEEREEEVFEEVPGGVGEGVRGVKAEGRLWKELAILVVRW